MTELIICGGVRLARHFCVKCNEYQLVKPRIKKCPYCKQRFMDLDSEVELRKIGQGVARKSIPKWLKDFLLDKQGNRCYWCYRVFGYFYIRNGEVKKSKIHADHIIPYIYLQSSPDDNWALSCSLCNSFKYSKYYEHEGEIRKYLKARWEIENIEIYYNQEDE